MSYKKFLSEALHIYNVSLKNNKGLETIKQLLNSLCNFYDSAIYEYLKKMKDEKKIEEIPDAPLKRLKLFEEVVQSKDFLEYIESYKKLRFCLNSEIMIKDEYRRTMKIICKSLDKEIEISQKDLKSIIEMAKKFSSLIDKHIV